MQRPWGWRGMTEDEIQLLTIQPPPVAQSDCPCAVRFEVHYLNDGGAFFVQARVVELRSGVTLINRRARSANRAGLSSNCALASHLWWVSV